MPRASTNTCVDSYSLPRESGSLCLARLDENNYGLIRDSIELRRIRNKRRRSRRGQRVGVLDVDTNRVRLEATVHDPSTQSIRWHLEVSESGSTLLYPCAAALRRTGALTEYPL